MVFSAEGGGGQESDLRKGGPAEAREGTEQAGATEAIPESGAGVNFRDTNLLLLKSQLSWSLFIMDFSWHEF